MVKITERPNDPIVTNKMVDAYMRWALEAVEEVAGRDGLAVVLRDVQLDKYIDNYPSNESKVISNVTFGDYAKLNAGLLTFYGRAGRGIVKRVGRITARKGYEHQSDTFNIATVLAAKTMPAATQIKLGITAIMSGFKIMGEAAGHEFKGTITDEGTNYHFIIETDPLAAGIQADGMVGWLMEGSLEQGARMAFEKELDVTQIACRAMGEPASIWEVPKQYVE